MTNPRLTAEQRAEPFARLFARVTADLEALTAGDPRLLWALRRKLAKELGYAERSTPAARAKLKALMWSRQNGVCAICAEPLPLRNSALDRTEAYLGYIEGSVRLVHHDCHVRDQARKGYR